MKKQPFSSPEEALEHYGVKGMRWGVRKDRETGDRDAGPSKDETGRLGPGEAGEIAQFNASTKAYMAAATKMTQGLSPEQQAANLRANRERFAQKFDGSDSVSKGVEKDDPSTIAKAREKWNALDSDQKKTLAMIGVYGAVAGGVVAYGVYASRYSVPGSAFTDMMGANSAGPGQKIGLGAYLARINKSQEHTYAVENFFRPEAFARPAFELPVGHTFHRISSVAEDTFTQATYASSNAEDFHRYAAALGVSGMKRHHVTFQAKDSIKIPALKDVLDTVREVQGSKTERGVLEAYKEISHGQWKGDDAKALIKALQKKGYSGIVDEMDAGVFSERPLVLFSNNKNFGPKSAKVLTRKDLKRAVDNLTEIPKPPGRAGYKFVKGQKLQAPKPPNVHEFLEGLAAQLA